MFCNYYCFKNPNYAYEILIATKEPLFKIYNMSYYVVKIMILGILKNYTEATKILEIYKSTPQKKWGYF